MTRMQKTLPILAVLCLLSLAAGQAVGQAQELSVSSVSASGYQDPNAPSNTLDDNLGTRWSQSGYTGVWIKYDLGSVETVSEVHVAWYSGDTRTCYFDVEVSTNDSNWTLVYADGESSGTTTQLETYAFDAASARYVRINGYGNSGSHWNSITETEIYGPPGDVTDGLVSRYTFDSDASDCVGDNDGTLTGGASIVSDGERGYVLSLDGDNDYVDLPTSGLTGGRSETTLSMWLKPDETTGTNTIWDEHNNWYWQFSLRQDTWATRDSSTGTTGGRNNDLAYTGLGSGNWKHLAVVYSVTAGTKEIYIDGESVTSTDVSVDALTSDRSGAYIGNASDGTYFDGKIDDVRLYNRALSESEIGILASGGSSPPETYTLTVNSGSGDGDYEEDYEANISADSPPAHMEFDEWVGDTAYVTSVTSSSTTVTMPADDVTVTATYTNILYTLTVNSGSGDGSYAYGTNVNISADGAPAHMEFDCWVGATSGIADVDDPTTSITMPGANATITATYTNILYTLTVNSGSGDGSYAYGTNVNISADAAPSGYEFDEWTGDTSGIASVGSSSTTITMPGSNATITATYAEAGPTTTLIVNWGDSAGNNVYSFSDWDNVYLGPYQSYSSAGPDGIVGSTTANYTVCGVNGAAESFAEGEQIVVTWYNNTGGSVTFTPTVSFNDPDYQNGGSGGTWYSMSQLQLAAAATGTTTYTLTSQTAGTYSRVHACRNIANAAQIVCDKIELVGAGGGGGPTYYTLTVNSGSGDGDYEEEDVVNISANAAASGYQFDDWIGNTSGIANVNASSTTLTMPAANQTITATYEQVQAGTPSVSGVSGTISQGSTITVSGSSFGSGPNVVVFDDFEGGTDGNYIMTGAGSARVGQWTSRSGEAYYSNDYSRSGNLCFEADMSGSSTRGSISAVYSSGTSELFLCWYVRIPEKYPGIDSQDRINWKHVWVMGNTSTIDDDIVPTFLGSVAYQDSCSILVTGNCGPVSAYTGWSQGNHYDHGDWVREHWYIKGGYTDGFYRLDMLTADGDWNYVERTGRTWGHRDDDGEGLPRQYERANFNGYGRQTSDCYPMFDDCYMAVGSNCKARVEIGNASTYSNCTKLAIQGPTSWSSSSITAKCNVGGLDPQDDWYLFVIDSDGDVSSGRPIN